MRVRMTLSITGKRMAKRSTIVVAAGIAVLYVAAIAVGLRLHDLSWNFFGLADKGKPAWQPPRGMPDGAQGESVRLGQLIFNETPAYAAEHVSGKLSCGSCHAEGGIQPYASPMVGLPALFFLLQLLRARQKPITNNPNINNGFFIITIYTPP